MRCLRNLPIACNPAFNRKRELRIDVLIETNAATKRIVCNKMDRLIPHVHTSVGSGVNGMFCCYSGLEWVTYEEQSHDDYGKKREPSKPITRNNHKCCTCHKRKKTTSGSRYHHTGKQQTQNYSPQGYPPEGHSVGSYKRAQSPFRHEDGG